MAWNRDKWLSAAISIPLSILIGILNLLPPRRVARRTNPLIEAIKRGDVEEVKLLIAQGADPNSREPQTVIKHGLWMHVVDIPEETAKTALMLAASEGHKDIVELLLDSGAEVNAKAGWGYTALSVVVGQEGDAEIVRILIDCGADVNMGFEPPLSIAAVGQRTDLIQLLLDSGANINACDDESFTALMEPAWYGYKEVVEVLLAAGIDVNARNKEGHAALWYAKEKNQREIVALLVRAGAQE